MNEKEAFALVYDELKKIPMLTGCFDVKNGSVNFMYGVFTVMEIIACKVDKTEEFDALFIENFEKSLKMA